MYLFFDTETTGLPRNYKAPVTDLNNWPRLVQLAYIQYDRNDNKISGGDYIIKPNGFIIPEDVSRIHGITHERVVQTLVGLQTLTGIILKIGKEIK
jgi:DNA polymerase III epsilon subunit-like protein